MNYTQPNGTVVSRDGFEIGSKPRGSFESNTAAAVPSNNNPFAPIKRRDRREFTMPQRMAIQSMEKMLLATDPRLTEVKARPSKGYVRP